MTWPKVVIVVTMVTAVFSSWLARYEVIGTLADGTAYRLDRWTGEVVFMGGPVGMRVKIQDK